MQNHFNRIRIGTLVDVLFSCLFAASIALGNDALAVFNGSMEQLPEGVSEADALGKVPLGWSVWYGGGLTSFSVGLTNERAFDGEYSMVVLNADGADGLSVSSKPMAVEGNGTYAAIVHVFNNDEEPLEQPAPLHVYLKFFSDEGWWGSGDFWSEEAWSNQAKSASPWSSTEVESIQHVTKNRGMWEEVLVIGTAPANAKYMTIVLWTSNYAVKSYVDGVDVARID